MQLLDEGLCNFNYRVDLDAGPPVVVRIYGRNPAACRKEVGVLRLVQNSVPVPDVLEACPEGYEDVGPLALLRYVEGITFRQLRRLGDHEAIAEAAYSIGETLAAIGRFEFAGNSGVGEGATIAPFMENPTAIPELVDECLESEVLRRRLDADLRERLHGLVWSRAPELARLASERSLVHCDFNNRNTLVRCERGRWRLAAVLDWEYAVSGSPLVDVGSFLRYERLSSPSREPHFSQGYLSGGGRLPEDWWRLARVVVLANLCEILTESELPESLVMEVVALVRATALE